MKILFIENREKSAFWNALAVELASKGHEIAWMVQNPIFSSNLTGQVFTIPFPRKADLKPGWDVAHNPILVTDRGRQYFASGSDHYSYYQQKIAECFTTFGPDIVVGEATLFHELLAVQQAEDDGIVFVNPTAERYPQGRFCLLVGATQEAIGGSGDVLSDDDALAYRQRFLEGRTSLVYMEKAKGWDALVKRSIWLTARGKVWFGRMLGERYNTPAMQRKSALARKTNANLQEWVRLSRNLAADEQAILFPMQMAPEANIDVWGRPFQDQLALIQRMLEVAPASVKIALKCNPKPKYELSDALIDLARTEPRLVLLPKDLPMIEAMAQTIGAVSVCGTVAYEAVLGRGRCVSLRHPILTASCPRHTAETPKAAVKALLSDPAIGRGTAEEAVALLQALYARSFPGWVSDPNSYPPCMDPKNIAAVADGCDAVFAKIKRRGSTAFGTGSI